MIMIIDNEFFFPSLRGAKRGEFWIAGARERTVCDQAEKSTSLTSHALSTVPSLKSLSVSFHHRP